MTRFSFGAQRIYKIKTQMMFDVKQLYLRKKFTSRTTIFSLWKTFFKLICELRVWLYSENKGYFVKKEKRKYYTLGIYIYILFNRTLGFISINFKNMSKSWELLIYLGIRVINDLVRKIKIILILKRCRNILKDQKGVANMVDNHIYPNINENMKGVEWNCQLILSFN